MTRPTAIAGLSGTNPQRLRLLCWRLLRLSALVIRHVVGVILLQLSLAEASICLSAASEPYILSCELALRLQLHSSTVPYLLQRLTE